MERAMLKQRLNGPRSMANAPARLEQAAVLARVLRHHHHASIHDHAEVKQA